MDREPRSLYPDDPLPELYISPVLIFIACVIFAVVFWTIGSIFRYYVPVGV